MAFRAVVSAKAKARAVLIRESVPWWLGRSGSGRGNSSNYSQWAAATIQKQKRYRDGAEGGLLDKEMDQERFSAAKHRSSAPGIVGSAWVPDPATGDYVPEYSLRARTP